MQLRTELEIDAPPEHVWRLLTDFKGYPTWNPFITRIDGELSVGARLAVTMSPPESAESTVRPRLVVCDAPRELRWVGQLWFKGLFEGEHFFQCFEAENGKTRFVQGENFSGVLVRFLGNRLTQVARGFVYMNQALKRRAESSFSASASPVRAGA